LPDLTVDEVLALLDRSRAGASARIWSSAGKIV
jgi:hypothetical protein